MVASKDAGVGLLLGGSEFLSLEVANEYHFSVPWNTKTGNKQVVDFL